MENWASKWRTRPRCDVSVSLARTPGTSISEVIQASIASKVAYLCLLTWSWKFARASWYGASSAFADACKDQISKQ